jgi:hypothetical protein
MGCPQACVFIILLAIVFLLIYLLCVWNNICVLYATLSYYVLFVLCGTIFMLCGTICATICATMFYL